MLLPECEIVDEDALSQSVVLSGRASSMNNKPRPKTAGLTRFQQTKNQIYQEMIELNNKDYERI